MNNETPTPRTDAEIEDLANGLRHMADDHRCCRATALDTIELIHQLKRELQACQAVESLSYDRLVSERDQLKKQFEISKGNTEAALNSFHAEMKQRRNAEAERDQLRKVCDWFATSVVNRGLHGDKPAIAHYNSLPHVMERKTK